MRKLRFLFPVFLMVLSASSATGQEKPPPPTPSPPQLISFPYFNSLGLNKAQKGRIKELDGKTRDAFVKDREAMEAAKKAFDEAMEEDTDTVVIRQNYEAFVLAHDAFLKTGFDQAMAVREILTPKQRKKFAELRRKLYHRNQDEEPSE